MRILFFGGCRFFFVLINKRAPLLFLPFLPLFIPLIFLNVMPCLNVTRETIRSVLKSRNCSLKVMKSNTIWLLFNWVLLRNCSRERPFKERYSIVIMIKKNRIELKSIKTRNNASFNILTDLWILFSLTNILIEKVLNTIGEKTNEIL